MTRIAAAEPVDEQHRLRLAGAGAMPPIVLLHGGVMDDFTRVEHAAEMARLIPNAQLAVLPGTTHMNIVERGDWIEPQFEARVASGAA